MSHRRGTVGLLLFGSGLCALVYQTVWLRELRLVFGASTLASAAVLAIFMGGLGYGGIVLGRIADRSRNPLALYGYLEVGVAVFAALTPLLLWVVRWAYLAMGGSFAMGNVLATIVRLLFSVLVLGVPTFLMGGTLPAAARVAESGSDLGRRAVAWLYAANTLGAVAGTLIATFFLLERFGNRFTLFAAALVNALVGLTALLISNAVRAPRGKRLTRRDELEDVVDVPDGGVSAAPACPPRLVFLAAAVVGFAFLLMELVWYRMLTPLLGGTTFTFGLILAAALAGIGSGSFAYALLRRERATVAAFALCCAFEALFLVIPFALGDRIAALALMLRSVGAFGFSGFVFGWTVIAALVVFPAAFVSGVQLPLLISLLGEGRESVGRHVGLAYAWNTAGAIAGSLAGGFGLLPLLTAPRAWQATVVLLAVLSLLMLFVRGQGAGGRGQEKVAAQPSSAPRALRAAPSIIVIVAALLFLRADGPTAFWRHTPIGSGRVSLMAPNRNALRDLEHQRRRTTMWEAEGIESSVSLNNDDGYAFLVNGRGDGHARFDAGTQVMGGVLAGLLHPRPRRAAVVGLGTGSTAGWLAALPSIERVDVVEIEPAIVHVAEMCTAVNHDALADPKVKVHIGDGRELLLAGDRRYDVISSEPSNPYRAGIANLFTSEFYEACLSRLDDGGIFIQFLQAYEIDARTVRTIYSTITGVFPHVETWQSQGGDLLLVGARGPLRYDEQSLGRAMAIEPVRQALHQVWWAHDAADVLARYVAGNVTARALATERPNTDDRPIVEYSFARTLGRADSFNPGELRDAAAARGDDLPAAMRGGALANEVLLRRLSIGVPHNAPPYMGRSVPDELRLRAVAQYNYVQGAYADAWTLWMGQKQPPRTPLEALTFAEVMAHRGDEQAIPFIEQVRRVAPVEAEALLGRLRWRQGKSAEAIRHFASALQGYRTTPWPLPVVMNRTLMFLNEISAEPAFAQSAAPIVEALSQPFAAGMYEELRKSTLLLVLQRLSPQRCSPQQRELLATYEPNVPWQLPFLEARLRCYTEAGDPRTAQAEADLREFQELVREPLE